MRLPILIGGLVSILNETCVPPAYDGSLFAQALFAYNGLKTNVTPLNCGDAVRGLLPILASASIPHSHITHEVSDPITWARNVKDGAWWLPCALTGRNKAACTNARFEEKLHVWCEVNRFIATSSSETYDRIHIGIRTTHLASLPPALEKCLAEFA